MFSLVSALSTKNVPKELSLHIQSYLDIASLSRWRATNKQAFLDVEELARQQLGKISKKKFVFKMLIPPSTAWFTLISQFFKCRNCNDFELVENTITRLFREKEWCSKCLMDYFNLIDGIAFCEQCGNCCIITSSTFSDTNQCRGCRASYCALCKSDRLLSCLGCSKLLCDACSCCSFCHDCLFT
jgi:hypothetical protein